MISEILHNHDSQADLESAEEIHTSSKTNDLDDLYDTLNQDDDLEF